ncbi:GntR family transcriptional regulator [Bombilactobacillus bombi]|uniref:GntR family transcriptional regulator n=1 Tax=Bombilactobacillus bombi TaxID=1303590 RepID=UPI0015E5FE90|nr:GntR family transcriptional regulator [Bombilactobacillus bombi]MBA1433851.1 GntR family transcriptional regulator [Bombilactobacillus bombi]
MIDYNSPMYLQIKEIILQKINNGEYEKNRAIPSERQLEKIYGVNRMTIKYAINSLVDDGILYRVQGKGTFISPNVRDKRIDIGNNADKGLTSEITFLGKQPSSKVIRFDVIKRNAQLDLIFKNYPKFSKFYRLSRVRLADKEPICVQIANIPFALYKGAERSNFNNSSLYDFMNKVYKTPVQFEEKMVVKDCPNNIEGYLNISNNALIYFCEYFGYTDENELVEYTQSYYRPDKIKFFFHLYKDNNYKN